MWCSILGLLLFAALTLSAPISNDEEPEVLFTCPENGECYASPRNCVDNCNAAFSITSENGTTTYNITMLSGLSYVAVLIRDQGANSYKKAVICTFHQPNGLVARIEYPDPIVIHEFIDTTEPEGHTDSLYTQCSTKVSLPPPTKATFKLISGKWESELVIDDKLGITVLPAVASARILSTNEKLNIPAPWRRPAVRAMDNEDESRSSESFLQKKEFEKRSKGGNVGEQNKAEDNTKKSSSQQTTTVETLKLSKEKEKAKKREETKEDSDEKTENDDIRERVDDSKITSEEPEEVPRWPEYETTDGPVEEDDEDDQNEDHDSNDDDDDEASAVSVLTAFSISIFSIYAFL